MLNEEVKKFYHKYLLISGLDEMQDGQAKDITRNLFYFNFRIQWLTIFPSFKNPSTNSEHCPLEHASILSRFLFFIQVIQQNLFANGREILELVFPSLFRDLAFVGAIRSPPPCQGTPPSLLLSLKRSRFIHFAIVPVRTLSYTFTVSFVYHISYNYMTNIPVCSYRVINNSTI